MADHPIIPTARQFLLLFYRAPGAAPADEDDQQRRDQEFDDWLRSIETRGELVMAGTLLPADAARLGPEGEVLESEPEREAVLRRVCVIRARDRAAAIETARRAPQVVHGAGAVVRELEAR
jgi:uncharacterized protein YciI